MELRASGLTLRPPTDADAPAIVAAVQSSLAELAPWMPWATPEYDEVSALRWIRGELGDAHRFVMVEDTVRRADAGALDADGDDDRAVADGTDEIIGSCGLNHVDELNRSANLGYWVRSDRAGLGRATTATGLLARYGLAVAGFQRLEVVMSTRNHASRRVAEKAGAVLEGTARRRLSLSGEFHDAHVWSIVPGDLDEFVDDGVDGERHA